MTQGQGRAKTGATVAAFLAALVLSGCSSTAGFEGTDPLTGGPPIQKRSSPAPTLAAGLASSPAPSATQSGQLPPVPTPATATSQAALAGGMSQPLDSGRDLRIGTPTALPGEQPLWRGTDATAQAGVHLADPQAPATVLPPTPAPAATPSIQSAPAMTLTAGTAQADTLDQAFRQLRSGRHVTWERLESLDKGGWSFQCAIENPATPDRESNYKSTGATEVEAVRKVLDQIALERR